MFIVLTTAIRAAQKSQLLAKGPPAENARKCRQIAVRYDGLYDQRLRIGFFGYGSFITPLVRIEPRDTVISRPVM